MLEGSHEFFVASAGAAAALAGLIIVAMTVNIETIIAIPGMTSRAATAIGLLITTTVVALAGLIDQPLWTFGVETLVVATASAALALDSMVRVIRGRGGRSLVEAVVKTAVGVVPPVLFGIGGVAALVGGAPAIWIGVGSLIAIVISVINAWVMLVEIKR